jgi:hypothetical protein
MSEEMTFGTSCRDCVFAEYNGDEQTGCEFDRLDPLEEHGARIVGQDDGSKRFFVIVGRVCNAHRTREWGKRHPYRWREAAIREFTVRVTMVIYLDAESTIDDMWQSLRSLTDSHDVSPAGVVFLLNDPKHDPVGIVQALRGTDLGFPWEVKQVVPREDGGQPDYGEAVDFAVKGIKSTFYCVARAGYEWPDGYLATIDNAVNYDMIRFIALAPDADGNALLMNTGVHNEVLHGNRGGLTVLEKIREVAAHEGTEHMIKTWDELRDRCE